LATTQNLPLPKNGVVYVQRSMDACSNAQHPLGYAGRNGDLTPYDCAAGDVFVKGVLSGRLTIASADDLNITGNITYSGGLTGADTLGLVANGFVQVYHPVTCSVGLPSAAFTCPDAQVVNADGSSTNITVNAAILSVGQSFTVQNYDKGSRLGTLTVVGGIYQKYRGAVGTSATTGTGYAKAYTFDSRLRSLPPPYFLDPASSPWTSSTGYAEVSPPAGLPQ
jgi:hypothetical protein